MTLTVIITDIINTPKPIRIAYDFKYSTLTDPPPTWNKTCTGNFTEGRIDTYEKKIERK